MFEGMLAKRYIFSQKRHSALTVCSIAIALALITMLFCVFSTVIGIIRNIACEQGEYHVSVLWLSKEEYDALEEAISEYGTCTPEEIVHHWENELGSGTSTDYYAHVIFNRYIGSSMEIFMESIGNKTGIGSDLYRRCSTNDLLMFCDMVDVQSATYMVLAVGLFYVFVLFLIAMLRLIIDTAFEISSKERERQFGVLQSIGATPQQIVRIITYEGLMLSVIGIPLGMGLGIGLGYVLFCAVLSTGVADLYLSEALADKLIKFSVNPWLLLLGTVTGLVWVMFSAYGTGTRVIKMSPVQAISARSNTVKKVRRNNIFGLIFGWTGEIASRNNMRRPKRYAATVISLTMSIALFSAVTVVIDNLRGRVDEYYKEIYLYRGDFLVHPYKDSREDPLVFRRYMEILEGSGLFSELYLSIDRHGNYGDIPYDDIWRTDTNIQFFSRDEYNLIFDGHPPVSYDELTNSGGYILGGKISGEAPDKVSIYFRDSKLISEEEYNALSEEEKLYVSDTMVGSSYQYSGRFSVELDVFMTADIYPNRICSLIGTLDQYANGEYKRFRSTEINNGISCVLRDEGDYLKALGLIERNFNDYRDNSTEMRQARSVLSSVNIGAAFFCVLIALIAIVNMVNILSTGILNRRGELAAMQCVGMTEKQLYKMTVIECLQYALSSGIGAAAVCELLLFLTDKMLYIVVDILKDIEYSVNYVQPLPIIGIASLCAFGIAIAASVIPLRAMQKTPLVEQIRRVE
ncbi:MAG: ABC transporter permease [Oscillospiraceae bacterium]|nr:ABC transporter permease [Oscillospiraceae bacterium]